MTPFRKLSIAIALCCAATVCAAFSKPIHIVAVGASHILDDPGIRNAVMKSIADLAARQ